jgi:hypothetical protein
VHHETTTPWRKVVVRDPKDPGEAALRFSPDDWQAVVAMVQARAPYSLGAWAAAPRGGSLLCHQRMITAARSPTQAAAVRMSH